MEIAKITGTTSGPSISAIPNPKKTMLPVMNAEKIFPRPK
jgi:hypothetical protein